MSPPGRLRSRLCAPQFRSKRAGSMGVEKLLIVTKGGEKALESARQQFGGQVVAVLSLGCCIDGQALPSTWRLVPIAEFAETERVSQEFLTFLDAWPRRIVRDGQTFDQLFRRRGGYSVWWTGPGRDRHPDRGLLPTLKALAICDHAIRSLVPRKVLLHVDDARLAAVLVSRCEGQVEWALLSGSVRPGLDPWTGRFRWLATSLTRLLLLPLKYLIRAICVRVLNGLARRSTLPKSDAAIVMVCEASRDVRYEGERMSLWFWEQFREAFVALRTGLVCRYRLVYRKNAWFRHPAWRMVARLSEALPADECYPALGSWWRELPCQIASIIRYFHLEGTGTFRASFRFAGADVAPLFIPQLRYAVARSIDWAQAVAAARRSLESSGRVSAMLVVKEMYASEIVTIAAARELGIPTVGVQHGAISPSHVMYTVPKGYIDGAPIPDYFAAYGEFAKDTVSVHGAYPAERVWVTGAPRFDHLVNNRKDKQAARSQLGLPRHARVLLLTTQSYPWFPEVAATLAAESRARRDWVLCIKTHPLSTAHIEVYRDLADSAEENNVRLFHSDLYELITACDVLISCSSTTVLEAVLTGRPTICVNFSSDPDQYPYAADGASVPARSPAELRQALITVFGPQNGDRLEKRRRDFLARHAGPTSEGKAAVTLARRIVELARPQEVSEESSRPGAHPESPDPSRSTCRRVRA